MMLTGANSREVVTAVKQRLAEIQAELPAGVEIRSYYDRAEFINRMLRTVAINLGEGAGLVVLILFLTLGQLARLADRGAGDPAGDGGRAHRHGAHRRHREPHVAGRDRLRAAGRRRDRDAGSGAVAAGAPPPARDRRAETIAQAMRQVARPVAFALGIILLVYLPLMALEGVEGRMFRPMAITVALALGGALAFSLTAFPALASYVLRVPAHPHVEGAGVFGRLQRLYARALRPILAHPQAGAGRGGAGAAAARWRCGAHAGRRVRARASTRASCRWTSSACRRCRSARRSGWACRSRRCWPASPRCARS